MISLASTRIVLAFLRARYVNLWTSIEELLQEAFVSSLKEVK
ncbi:hypothetical protein JOC54_003695 [Alkalihalobacillus xiaoxiensis]|uniref:Uncharacterized protein n=1 Tax=Shouchella xiaoxiensis TaxID=766895 RepID=A0ABS2T117_9BACI|nr:hypothetical protein [Shouchella xiaoxiensis]